MSKTNYDVIVFRDILMLIWVYIKWYAIGFLAIPLLFLLLSLLT